MILVFTNGVIVEKLKKIILKEYWSYYNSFEGFKLEYFMKKFFFTDKY